MTPYGKPSLLLLPLCPSAYLDAKYAAFAHLVPRHFHTRSVCHSFDTSAVLCSLRCCQLCPSCLIVQLDQGMLFAFPTSLLYNSVLPAVSLLCHCQTKQLCISSLAASASLRQLPFSCNLVAAYKLHAATSDTDVTKACLLMHCISGLLSARTGAAFLSAFQTGAISTACLLMASCNTCIGRWQRQRSHPCGLRTPLPRSPW